MQLLLIEFGLCETIPFKDIKIGEYFFMDETYDFLLKRGIGFNSLEISPELYYYHVCQKISNTQYFDNNTNEIQRVKNTYEKAIRVEHKVIATYSPPEWGGGRELINKVLNTYIDKEEILFQQKTGIKIEPEPKQTIESIQKNLLGEWLWYKIKDKQPSQHFMVWEHSEGAIKITIVEGKTGNPLNDKMTGFYRDLLHKAWKMFENYIA